MVNNTKDLRKKVYYNNATYYYLKIMLNVLKDKKFEYIEDIEWTKIKKERKRELNIYLLDITKSKNVKNIQ